MKRFRKGELGVEALRILMYDLEALRNTTKEDFNHYDFNYHYKLLRGNIIDIFGYPESIKCPECKGAGRVKHPESVQDDGCLPCNCCEGEGVLTIDDEEYEYAIKRTRGGRNG